MDLLKRLSRVVDWRVLGAVVALLAAPELHAHGVVEGASAFFAGLTHPLTALEHVLPLIALGLLAGQRGLRNGEGLVIAFPVAFACGALVAPAIVSLPDLSAVNATTALVVGVLVALALAISKPLLYAVVVVTGAVHGFANGGAIEHAMPQFIAGATLAATLLFVYAFGVTDYALRRQRPWLPVAVRAIGSWIAAFGILTVALAFTTATPLA